MLIIIIFKAYPAISQASTHTLSNIINIINNYYYGYYHYLSLLSGTASRQFRMIFVLLTSFASSDLVAVRGRTLLTSCFTFVDVRCVSLHLRILCIHLFTCAANWARSSAPRLPTTFIPRLNTVVRDRRRLLLALGKCVYRVVQLYWSCVVINGKQLETFNKRVLFWSCETVYLSRCVCIVSSQDIGHVYRGLWSIGRP